MRATILDLRRRMPEVLRALDRQGQVTILHRGQPRAVLVPAGTTGDRPGPQRASELPAFGMWADREDLATVPEQVRTWRQGRQHAV